MQRSGLSGQSKILRFSPSLVICDLSGQHHGMLHTKILQGPSDVSRHTISHSVVVSRDPRRQPHKWMHVMSNSDVSRLTPRDNTPRQTSRSDAPKHTPGGPFQGARAPVPNSIPRVLRTAPVLQNSHREGEGAGGDPLADVQDMSTAEV